jgi:hypothetical protein
MKLHVALLCIVFAFNACLKDKEDKTIATEPVLTKAQMLEDFEIFQSIFEKANAGLYKYRSQRQVDSLFAVKKNKSNFQILTEHFIIMFGKLLILQGAVIIVCRIPKI